MDQSSGNVVARTACAPARPGRFVQRVRERVSAGPSTPSRAMIAEGIASPRADR